LRSELSGIFILYSHPRVLLNSRENPLIFEIEVKLCKALGFVARAM